jgi:hypothetical protein
MAWSVAPTDRGEPGEIEGLKARGFVEDPIRGTHQGLRSVSAAHEAGHMTASSLPQNCSTSPLRAGGHPHMLAGSGEENALEPAPARRRSRLTTDLGRQHGLPFPTQRL